MSRLPDPLPVVRSAVRDLLAGSASYRALPPDQRQKLAHSMVQVGHTAALLVREEMDSREAARAVYGEALGLAASPAELAEEPALAVAQSAGSEFSGVAAEKVAGVTTSILNAVSFPRFVSELITGVFKAISDSSMQQMNAFLQLLNGVAASTEGFEASTGGDDRARAWLVDHYPGSFELSTDDDPEADPEDKAAATVRLRSGAEPPSPDAIRTDLGLDPDETVPSGDPDRTLVPLARRRLAKSRQEMLATMVNMGMQRIVIDAGRINASMRFHIDTRSAAQQDKGTQFDMKNQFDASGSFGMGAWGASAHEQNTIAYVSTERTSTTEEMNTDLDLNSSVEVQFRSDYLPLDRMAKPGQVDRIRANSINPDAEAQAAIAARTERARLAGAFDQARNASLSAALDPNRMPAATSPPPAPPPAKAAAPVTKVARPRAKPSPTATNAARPAAAPAPAATTAAPASTGSNTVG